MRTGPIRLSHIGIFGVMISIKVKIMAVIIPYRNPTKIEAQAKVIIKPPIEPSIDFILLKGILCFPRFFPINAYELSPKDSVARIDKMGKTDRNREEKIIPIMKYK